jgi:excisionase family DNA binding protein
MSTLASDTITVAQAAEALGVSERTVWRYLKSGRLPGETVGEPGAQRTLIPREAVEAIQRDRGGADVEALRAERDRLAGQLAGALAERDALSARVAVLQRALSRPAPAGAIERVIGRAIGALARARAPRVSSAR